MSNRVEFCAVITLTARELDAIRRYDQEGLPEDYFSSPLFNDDVAMRTSILRRLIESAKLIAPQTPDVPPVNPV